ncbi:MAG: type IX secretion system sortase PorU [Lentimicrobiaceae bacterium]|nr:type IX secretion system sortase PorU [Lentimicrobiaceae bacterium]
MRNKVLLLIFIIFSVQITFAQIAITEDSTYYKAGIKATVSTYNSVLETGSWYKIGVKNTGIYKITYNDLSSMGINVSSINPHNIRIYGNGGGMLPEANRDARYDDLIENPIFVSGEEDGKFDPNDYILFYGQSPTVWKYNLLKNYFEHNLNIYSDYTYYFITTDSGIGKRISLLASSSLSPTNHVNTFNDYAYHEEEKINLIKSGRIWLGEVFDAVKSYDFNFNFPDLNTASPVILNANVAAKSPQASVFSFTIEGEALNVVVNFSDPRNSHEYAVEALGNKEFMVTSPSINVKTTYNKPASSSIGWLNFIELNVIRNLIFHGGQLPFRDITSVGDGKIAELRLESSASETQVWDVTYPDSIARLSLNTNGNINTYRWQSSKLHEFVAFDGSLYYQVENFGKIDNQNLHALEPTEMLIITHPDVSEQAYRLATFHAEHDNLSVTVVTPQQIYNEFSSGAQDISAIRDFIKMLYDRGQKSTPLQYVLLFGDGSYDYKDYLQNNTNKIPSFQSKASYNDVTSYVTDDYFGFLENNEGNTFVANLDVGIGRLPVNTLEEAEKMVDKIMYYSVQSPEIMGEWRNIICFVADDEEGNIHIEQTEAIAKYIESTYPTFNIDKIYLDAYEQVSTPGGNRYPDVNVSINKRVEKGALFLNYTGHGGEVGWAHERVLEINDIESWKNINNLPCFVTATCEFSRFDDPGRVSAGELVFLNPNGGAIAMFTTTRPTYGDPNAHLNMSLYKYALQKLNDKNPKLGDILKLAKRENGSDPTNGQKFILLGDPAITINYPELKVVTTSIIDKFTGNATDTLKALSDIEVRGEIRDIGNRKVDDFNGTVNIEVFDKINTIETKGNDGGSTITFQLRKSIIYKGKANVTNGNFVLNFIVPRDIAFQYGNGKLSFYAYSDKNDASGYDNNIIVGGMAEYLADDDAGPDIQMYINDKNFESGGITDENPKLYAYISDSSGINTVGNGIGHDIIAVLDGNTEEPQILNDYYESVLNTYKEGFILYPFFGLTEGLHTISLKVWDVFNHSSQAYIEFYVKNSGKFNLTHVLNAPNPFSDETKIIFDHNQAGKQMKAIVKIYSSEGQLVTSMESTFTADGYRSVAAVWNGKDSNGSSVRQGLYLYRLNVITNDGYSAEKGGKLVVVKN